VQQDRDQQDLVQPQEQADSGLPGSGHAPRARGPFEPVPDSERTSAEPLDFDDEGDLVLHGDGALEQIMNLYVTAERIGDKNLDGYFERLLDRQRQLISEYFKEPDAVDPNGGSNVSAGSGQQNVRSNQSTRSTR
jgi:hypothetical protein